MNTNHLTLPDPARSCRSIRMWLLSGLCAAASLLTTQAQLEWELLHPEPTHEKLNDIAYDGSRFVAVGNHNTIVTSTDGTNWTWVEAAERSAYNGVAAGMGHWVTVGFDYAQHSHNGTNWFSSPGLGNFHSQFSAAYGNHRFVSVGDRVAYATAPGQWEFSEYKPENRLLAVTYGVDKFIAVGFDGRIVRSEDGQTWVPSSNVLLHNTTLFDVTYGGGKFVAVGNNGVILISDDGMDWQRRPIVFTGWFNSVAHGNGLYVATTPTGIAYTSADGIQWTQAPLPIPSEIEAVTHGNGVFVAVAEGGMIYTSTTGVTWSAVTSPRVINVTGIAQHHRYGNLIVTGPNEVVLASTNGAEWELHHPEEIIGISKLVHAYNSLFVGLDARGKIATSTNGLDWISTPISTNSAYLNGILWGAFRNIYVVGDGGRICYNTLQIAGTPPSPWIQLASPITNDLHDLAEGRGVMVAIADREIINTTDGTNWTSVFTTTNNTIMRAVAYGQNRFVAVGQGESRFAMVVTSTNGFDWETIYLPHVMALFDIAYGNGRFVAIGNGIAYESLDGLNWTEERSLTSSGLRAVEFLSSGVASRQAFYALGTGGVIFRATHVRPRLADITRPEPGSMRFVLIGETGRNYHIESSTDLTHWNLYTETGPINYPTNIYNFPTSEGPNRFFRAVRQP